MLDVGRKRKQEKREGNDVQREKYTRQRSSKVAQWVEVPADKPSKMSSVVGNPTIERSNSSKFIS